MLKASLQLRLGQQLTMTPQLQQAIRLLQLPSLELQAHIRELLETNVMLEADDDAEATADLRGPGLGPQRARAASARPANGARRRRRAHGNRRSHRGFLDRDHRRGRRDTLELRRRRPPAGIPRRARRVAARAPAVAAGAGAARRPRAGHRPRDHRCRSTTTATSAIRWTTIAATLRPEIDADAAEIEAMLARRAGVRSAGRRRAHRGECVTLQLRAARPADARTRHGADCWPRNHLDLLALRDMTVLRRELQGERGRVAGGAGAGARLPSAPRRADQLHGRGIRHAGRVRAPHARAAGAWR